MKKIIVLLLCNIMGSCGANSVIFFFRPYGISDQQTLEKLARTMQSPGKLNRYLIKQQFFDPFHMAEGIFCSYMGYSAVSNLYGQVTFPRHQVKPLVYFLVTPKVIPVMMIGATVHHLETDPTVPHHFVALEYKQNEATGMYLWHSTVLPVPDNNIIPLNTIIIFANPDSLYIPEGVSIVQKQVQMVLPDVFVKSNDNRIAHTMWVLLINHFFKPVAKKYKTVSPTYFMQHIIE